MKDLGTHTLTIGRNSTIVPMGFNVIVTGRSEGFDDDMVGLIFKALPDDLCERAAAGEPINEADIARLQAVSDFAETVFIHCKDPAALDDLADMATTLAAEWRAHLENKA